MSDLPGRIVGRIPVVDAAQTDIHPWWACHCDACAADRRLFLGDTSPIPAADAARKLVLVQGDRKW